MIVYILSHDLFDMSCCLHRDEEKGFPVNLCFDMKLLILCGLFYFIRAELRRQMNMEFIVLQ